MKELQILSLIANILIVLGGSFFIISIFGRKSPTIEALPIIERWSIKAALCITAAGSLFNILILATPPWSEVMLDFGLGCIFIWGAFFHFKYFVWKDEK